MMEFNDLDARVVRERIDMVQLWNAWSEADQRRRHSFVGSMNWETRNGKQYLYSRKGRVAKSLGPRSDATEKVLAAFAEGKRDNADRLKALKGEMERQASVLRALDAGRPPVTAARTLRALRDHPKGTNIRVVGTNALYAYEALAGVAFNSSSTATGDIDFLVDDRNRLKLIADDGNPTRLTRLIQMKVDRTFKPRRPGDFRLTNDKGYMIEFIRRSRNPLGEMGRERIRSGRVTWTIRNSLASNGLSTRPLWMQRFSTRAASRSRCDVPTLVSGRCTSSGCRAGKDGSQSGRRGTHPKANSR